MGGSLSRGALAGHGPGPSPAARRAPGAGHGAGPGGLSRCCAGAGPWSGAPGRSLGAGPCAGRPDRDARASRAAIDGPRRPVHGADGRDVRRVASVHAAVCLPAWRRAVHAKGWGGGASAGADDRPGQPQRGGGATGGRPTGRMQGRGRRTGHRGLRPVACAAACIRVCVLWPAPGSAPGACALWPVPCGSHPGLRPVACIRLRAQARTRACALWPVACAPQPVGPAAPGEPCCLAFGGLPAPPATGIQPCRAARHSAAQPGRAPRTPHPPAQPACACDPIHRKPASDGPVRPGHRITPNPNGARLR